MTEGEYQDAQDGVYTIFDIIAPEFQRMDAMTKKTIFDITLPLVSKDKFRDKYHQAVALLMAHRLTMLNASKDGSGNDVPKDNTFRIASFSEGDSSMSFNSPQIGTDADLYLSNYGIQYVFLRKMTVVPIII